MGLFNKKNKSVETKFLQDDILVFPSENFKINNNLVVSILETILELGDEEDLKIILKNMALNLFNNNKKVLINSQIIKNDNLEILTNNLNLFFNSLDIGNFILIINKKNAEILIKHKNFKYPEYFIVFLKEFYKLIFSEILENEINLELNEGDKDEIVFKIIK